ncbi:MAG: hypothetical protein ACHQQS_19105, partial [Thermoanaerobaculales bacterium]
MARAIAVAAWRACEAWNADSPGIGGGAGSCAYQAGGPGYAIWGGGCAGPAGAASYWVGDGPVEAAAGMLGGGAAGCSR